MSERNSRQYLAWVNALQLTLREIGLKESIAARPLGRQRDTRLSAVSRVSRSFSVCHAPPRRNAVLAVLSRATPK
jgi:hypothetical protein